MARFQPAGQTVGDGIGERLAERVEFAVVIGPATPHPPAERRIDADIGVEHGPHA